MNGVLTLTAIVLGIAIVVFVPALATAYDSGFGPGEAMTTEMSAKAVLFGFALAAMTCLLIRRWRQSLKKPTAANQNRALAWRQTLERCWG